MNIFAAMICTLLVGECHKGSPMYLLGHYPATCNLHCEEGHWKEMPEEDMWKVEAKGVEVPYQAFLHIDPPPSVTTTSPMKTTTTLTTITVPSTVWNFLSPMSPPPHLQCLGGMPPDDMLSFAVTKNNICTCYRLGIGKPESPFDPTLPIKKYNATIYQEECVLR